MAPICSNSSASTGSRPARVFAIKRVVDGGIKMCVNLAAKILNATACSKERFARGPGMREKKAQSFVVNGWAHIGLLWFWHQKLFAFVQ